MCLKFQTKACFKSLSLKKNNKNKTNNLFQIDGEGISMLMKYKTETFVRKNIVRKDIVIPVAPRWE